MWWNKNKKKQTLSESELIDGCIKQNRKAQAQLFEQYQRLVMGLCLRYAHNQQDAEDIFQEAFIRIFIHLPKSKPIQSLGKWIRKIAINTAINHYHKNQKHTGHLPYEVKEVSNQEYRQIIDKLSNDELIQIINGLPEGYKWVFNLAVIDGYGHKEIAAMLNISESTSRSQLVRARRQVKIKLQKIGIDRYETIS